MSRGSKLSRRRKTLRNTKRQRQNKNRTPQFEKLEERRLLAGLEVFFVDPTVWNLESLPPELVAQADEVVVLDADSDGIQQMADYLDGRNGIGAINIVSHGTLGEISPVGNAVLNIGNVGNYSTQFATIGNALTADGDILLWGCNIAGSEGTDFVQSIADATGADVAASDNLTGSPTLGGDWDLEFITGPIDASNLLGTIDPQITLSHGTQLFFDNFETGSLSSSKWSVRNAFVDSDTNDDQGPNNPPGTYAAELDGAVDDLRTVSINLSAYDEAELNFVVQAEGNEDAPESEDDLLIYYRTSSGSWSFLRRIDQSSVSHSGFTSQSISLPSGALHSTTRFWFDARLSDCCQNNGDGWDNWFVDNVSVFGNRRPNITHNGGNVGSQTNQNTNAGTRFDDQSTSLSWSATDPDPGSPNVSTTLFRPGTDLTSSSTSSGFSIPAGSALGTYTLRVTATDNGGLSRTQSRWITVVDDDTTGPTISFSNAVNQNDGQDNLVGWSISDVSGISSRTVRLYNGSGTGGSILFSNTSSNSSGATPFNLNSLSPGTYTMWATATDNDTDRGSSDRRSFTRSQVFTISDDDTTGPVITLISPSVQPEGVGAAANFQLSESSASRLSSYTARLFVGTSGTQALSPKIVTLATTNGTGPTSFTDGFNLSSLSPGSYRLEVTAFNNDRDRGTADLESNFRTQFITIIDPNDPPDAVDDVAGEVTINEDGTGPVNITGTLGVAGSGVLGNDSDPDGDTPISIVSINDTTTLGVLNLTAGVLTYDPNGEFEYLSQGETATQTFTYTIEDPSGESDTATVVLTINGEDDAPDIAAGDTGTLMEAAETANDDPTLNAGDLTDGGNLAFNDVDDPDTFTADVTGVAAAGTLGGYVATDDATLLALMTLPNGGVVTEGGGIDWSFTGGEDLFDYLSDSQSIVLTYTIKVTDNDGLTDTDTVVLTINGKDDAPDIAAGDSGMLMEAAETAAADPTLNAGDLTDSGNLAFNDVDDPDTFSADVIGLMASGTLGAYNASDDVTLLALMTLPNGGVVTEGGGIDWSFTGGEDLFDYLSDSQSIVLTYTIKVTDNDGLTDTDTVVLTINGKDDAPDIAAGDTGTLMEAAEAANDDPTLNAGDLTESGNLAFNDVDDPDTFTADVTGLTATGTLGAYNASDDVTLLALMTLPNGGAVTEAGGIDWSFTGGEDLFDYLSAGESLVLTYTIEVTDNDGLTDTDTVVLTINGKDDAPDIVAGDTGTLMEATETANDDPTLNAGDLTDSGNLAFNDVDDPDTFTADVTSVAAAGTLGGYVAVDDATLLALMTLPNGGVVTEGGGIDWSFTGGEDLFDYLSDGQSIVLTYTIEVTDNDGLTDTDTVVLTINGKDDAPDIAAGDSGTLMEAAEAANDDPTLNAGDLTDSGNLAFNDVDDPDTFTADVTGLTATGTLGGYVAVDDVTLLALMTLPNGGAVTEAGGIDWSFTGGEDLFDYLSDSQSIVLTYTIKVTDNDGLTDTDTVVLTINGKDDAPDIGAGDTGTLMEAAEAANDDPTLNAGDLTDSGNLAFNDVDDPDTFTADVTGLTATGTLGAYNASDDVTLLALMTLPNGGAVTEAGGIDWSFTGGEDLFDYLSAGESIVLTYTIEVTDNDGLTDTDTVVLTINGKDDAPDIAAGDSGMLMEAAETAAADPTLNAGDLTDSGNLAFNDVDDPDTFSADVIGLMASGTLGAFAAVDDATLLALMTLPNGGVVTEGGGIDWSFTGGEDLFDYLSAGQSMVLTYTIEVTDNDGLTDTDTVVLTINGKDDAPDIAAGDSGMLMEAAETAAADPTLNAGDLTDSGNLAFNDVDDPDTFSADVIGLMASGTLGAYNASDDVTLLALMTLPNGGVVTEGGGIDWSFTGGEDLFDYLSDGQSIVLTYTIEVTDNDGLTDTDTVVLTINGKDDAPDIAAGDSGTLMEAAEAANDDPTLNAGDLTDSGNLAFNDVDDPDTFTADVTGLTATGTLGGYVAVDDVTLLALMTLPNGGAVTEAGGIDWSFTGGEDLFDYLSDSQSIVLTYTIKVTDNDGLTDTDTVVLTINGKDDAPDIGAGDTGTLMEAAEAANDDPTLNAGDLTDSGNLAFNDVDDPDTFSADVIGLMASGTLGAYNASDDVTLLALMTLPNGGAVTEGGGIDWSFTGGEDLFDYLSAGESIVLTYTIEVTDNDGLTDTDTVVLTINGKDDAPDIAAGDSGMLMEAAETAAADPTLNAGDLTDSGNLAFNDVDDPDTFSADVIGLMASGTLGAFAAVDDATLLALMTLPNGGVVTEGGGIDWSFTGGEDLFDYLSAGQSMVLTYTIEVTDNDGLTDTDTVVLTINGKDDAPDIAAGDTGTLMEAAEVANDDPTLNAGDLTDSGNLAFNDVDDPNTFTADVTSLTATGTLGGYVAVDDATLLALMTLPNGGVVTEGGGIDWSFTGGEDLFDYLSDSQSIVLTYTIKVTDNDGLTDTDTVVLTINGKDDAPDIAAGDTGTLMEATETANDNPTLNAGDLTESGNLAFNDVDDPDTFSADVIGLMASGTLGAYNASDDVTLLALMTLPNGGAVTEAGGIDWSFTGGEDLFDYLSAGESLVLTYTIEVTDNDGLTDTDTVVLTINGKDDAPDIVAGDTGTLMEATETANDDPTLNAGDLTDSGNLAFNDVDDPDTFTADVTGLTATGTLGAYNASDDVTLLALMTLPNGGAVTEAGGIDWSFTGGEDLFDYLSDGQSIVLTYTIEVTDNDGLTDTDTVVLTIDGKDDAPDIAAGDSGMLMEAAETANDDPTLNAGDLTDSGNLAFNDVDDPDTFTADVTSVAAAGTLGGYVAVDDATLLALMTLPNGGVVTEGGGIDWSFTGGEDLFDYLSAGESIVLTYTIEVTDNDGLTDTDTVVLTINGKDDAPDIAAGDSGMLMEAAETAAADPTLNAGDLTDSGNLAFNDVDDPNTFTADVTSLTATGTLGGYVAVDDATLLALMTLPNGGVVTEGGGIDWSFTGGEDLFDYLSAGQSMVLTYTIEVTDNDGLTDTDTVVLTINGKDDAPDIAAGDTGTLMEAAEVANDDPTLNAGDLTDSGNLAFNDVDDPNTFTADVTSLTATGTLGGYVAVDDATLLALMTLPNGGVVTEGGGIDWSFTGGEDLFDYLSDSQSIVLTYTIKVTDNDGLTDTDTVVLTINGKDDAPDIAAGDTGTLMEATETANDNPTLNAGDLTESGNLAFNDVDDPDTFTADVTGLTATGTLGAYNASDDVTLLALMTLPNGGAVTEAGGIDWSFTGGEDLFDYLSAGESLVLTYTIEVTDNDGLTDTDTVVLTINGKDDAPDIVAGDTGTLMEATETANDDPTLNAGDLTDSGNLAFNDVDDPDTFTADVTGLTATGTLGAYNASDDVTLLALMTLPNGGAVTEAGGIDWSFTGGEDLFDYLSDGQSIVLTYTIEVTDNDGLTDTDTVVLTIDGKDDAPDIAAGDSGMLMEAAETANDDPTLNAGDLTDSGNLAFNDVDDPDTFTADVTSVAAAGTLGGYVAVDDATLLALMTLPNGGVVTEGGGIDWSFTGGEDLFDYLSDGQSIVLTYTIEVTDNDGLTDTDTVVLTINGKDDAPDIAAGDSGTLMEAAEAANDDPTLNAGDLTDSGNLAFNDVDDPDTFTADVTGLTATGTLGGYVAVDDVTLLALMTLPNGGAVTEAGGIDWSFTGGEDLFDYLSAGESIVLTYTIEVTDNDGLTDTDTVVLTINGKNDAPDIAAGDTSSIIEDENDPTLTDNGTLDFIDVDLSDTHTVNASAAAAVWSGGPTLPAGLQAALDAAIAVNISDASTGDGEGTIGWNFALANAAVQFLATGETLTATYTVTVTDSPTGAFDTDTIVVTITGTNDAPVAEVPSVESQDVQYSDEIADITFDFSDVDSEVMTAEVSYSTNGGTSFQTGLPDTGTLEPGVGFSFNGGSIANPSGFGSTGSWTVSGIADLEPGTYIIQVTATDDEGASVTSDSEITVNQENAVATYSGMSFASTPSVNNDEATVELRATIQDITAALPAGTDQDAGNITYATVSFIDNSNPGTPITIVEDLPVTLLNAGDLTVGIASFSWVVDIGNQDSETFDIIVKVDSFYTYVDYETDVTLITVSKPKNNAVTGGGYIINESSAGQYAGEDGLRTNYGFNIKTNRRGTNVQGHVNIIVRQDGKIYQIKTNATNSLVAIPPGPGDDPDILKAEFSAKANLKDITDPNNPISLGGNLQLLATITDAGEPGILDMVGFTLWDGSTLLYSSNWTGTATTEQLIDGGNIQVRLNSPGNMRLAPTTTPQTHVDRPIEPQQLESVFQNAIRHWAESGIDEHQLAQLSNVELRIAELSEDTLGASSGNVVWIDNDAAGYGWFAGDDVSNLASSQQVDLLSVVSHELGHVLGLEHSADNAVMQPTLSPGDQTFGMDRVNGQFVESVDSDNLELAVHDLGNKFETKTFWAMPAWRQNSLAQFSVADRALAGNAVSWLPVGTIDSEDHDLDGLVQSLEIDDGLEPELDLDLDLSNEFLDDLVGVKTDRAFQAVKPAK